MNKYIGIGLVIALLVAAGGFILKQATSKEDHRAIDFGDEGTYIESNSQGWSIGGYMEKSTDGKGVLFGVSLGYKF